MHKFSLGQEITPYKIIGHNYATNHDNKIHSDEVAAQFGFKGGLVPGVGVYAYLTHPVVETFGAAWIERGAMTAKFLKPVYHGEEVIVRGKITSLAPLTIHLELFNPTQILCAVATATMPATQTEIYQEKFPWQELPELAQKPEARMANFPAEKMLGSLAWEFDHVALAAKFLKDVCASLPIYFGAQAICHPAFYLAQANEILMTNMRLGPWIHTGSEVQHYALPRPGAQLSLRGKIAESFAKRGHEFVVLTLSLFTDNEHLIAHIRHTAIIHLAAS